MKKGFHSINVLKGKHGNLTLGFWMTVRWLFWLTSKGLVVVSGCAHAGIINTVRCIQNVTALSDVYAIVGGFHLAGKENEARIGQTVEELKRIDPKRIVPCHCTGWRGKLAIAEALPDAFIWNSVGNRYSF